MPAATGLLLIVGCRYSHFGGLHGRDLAPLWRGFLCAAGRTENPAGGLTAGLGHGLFHVMRSLPCAVQPTV